MNRFWKRDSESELEGQLRADRPKPPAELMQRLTQQVTRESRVRGRARPRLVGAAVALTAVAAIFGSFGGIGYAASAAKSVVVASKTALSTPFETRHHAVGKPTVPSKGQPTAPNSNTGAVQSAKGNDHGGKPDEKEYGHRTKLCHKYDHGTKFKTIEVNDRAVPAFLARDDYTLGACHT